MSNLGPFNNSKNTPWARPSTNNIVNQNNALQHQILSQGGLGNMGSTNMVQFQPQHQVFQNAMGMQQQNMGLGLQQMTNPSVLTSNQLLQQVGTVTYPNPRALNPTAFQTQGISAMTVQSSNNPSSKQRVFTGTVTKVHDNFGFVDEDVFFQTSACVQGSNPMVGDRVLVEASYNPSMPFKWNATRIQVLPTSGHSSSHRNSNQKNMYGTVPPPNDSVGFGKSIRSKAGSGRGRERSRDHDDEEVERKRRREERIREREKEEKKSPLRRRSRSPKSSRRRSRIVPRYMVQIPKINLELKSADVLEIRRRYNNLYVPSDFFCSYFRWVDAFPPSKPFVLSKPSLFHIMHKDVDPVVENDAVLEPPDADYIFSVKVMLMSVPGMEEIFVKCCAMAEDKDKRDRDSEDRDYVHPTRLIQFLVGIRGKNETMAIGGPWSRSADGDSPGTNPSVLIRTAIRTCKALTGIDLSPCTQWYRFLELYYHRSESTHKGKVIPARVETVVLFLPDVWSCLPTRLEWDGLHLSYRKQLECKLKADQESEEHPTADEKDEEPSNDSKFDPTHYSQLDPKNLNVADLRTELRARNLNSKGLKSQLIAKLTKALKGEAEKAEDSSKECQTEPEGETGGDEKKTEIEDKKLDEKEKAQLEKRYALPEQLHIIVHPSRSAKSGKFDCTCMSLSVLLDYSHEDTKEHSFEVSLFAELFNEMLMRDFGFNIYKALFELPEKVKEKDDKKHKDDDDKSKKDDKKNDDRKKDDRKDKKRDDVNSEDDDDDFEDDDSTKDKRKSDKDRKKKERTKMFTKDRALLLSFVYFDQTHCGYIFEKDMEDLLFMLGLNLSRAQVRKLVGKVISRDSLHYRKLTDKPKEDDFIVIDDSEKDTNLAELAAGNKKLLPIFSTESATTDSSPTVNSEDGLVMFCGGLVDVVKLMAQLERSDRARVETEARMIDLKTENTKVTEKYTKSSSSIKSLNSEVKELKEKLRNSDDSLIRMTACYKLFQATLSDIRDKIDPVLKSTQYLKEDRKEMNEKERKHEEGRSRWEKHSRDFTPKEQPMDVNVSENLDIKFEIKDEVSS